jgi:hypothetical protein
MIIKKTALVLTTLLIANTALADNYPKEEKTTNFIVTPSVAYRYDVFKWSIPDEVFADRKASELTWKNYIVQPSIKIELEPQPNEFTFLGQGKYGYILKNKSKSWDKDWKFSKIKGSKERIYKIHSNKVSNVKGNILDLSGAVGYSINLFSDNLITFYLGYDYTDYRNNQYGIYNRFNNKNVLQRPLDQLVTRYNFKTKSPWVGLSLNVPILDNFLVKPTIKYYSFKYVAKAFWLLREDFKKNPSFKHTAKGIGLGADIDLVYRYSNNLDFNINLETKNFKMRKGQDQTFLAANRVTHKPESVATRKLLGLSLTSYSISGGIKYKF